jgi:hydroxyethylthiazole kinase-like uncharacterized protein yjeF
MDELLTTTQMSEADLFAVAAGVPGAALMESAGRAVADTALGMLAGRGRVVVAAGPGNNGGDGFVAARLLAADGVDVRVALIGHPSALRGDAAEMLRLWTGEIAPAAPAALNGANLVIDAIFGAGLSRPPDGAAAELIAAINASQVSVLSVDVPSGLDGSTGEALGPVVRANRTITFFRKKPGHLLLPGRALCGDVTVADIGIPPSALDVIQPDAFENAPSLWRGAYPWPGFDSHKYTRGHAVVVSGPAERTGAARLGARAALRVGAGLVTLIGDRAATAINAVHMTSVMVRTVAGDKALAEFLADARRNAVVIGPGAAPGDSAASDVLATLRSNAAVTIDADALTAFARPEVEEGSGSARFGFVPGKSDDAPVPGARRRSY